MVFIKPLTPTDGLFLVSLTALAVAFVTDRRVRSGVGRTTGTIGWIVFGGFWALEGGSYLPGSRVFLAVVSFGTAVICAYVATLVVRDRPPWRRITAAFLVMGLVFVPYQFVLPVYHAVLELVTAHTVWGLERLGFQPTVEIGVTGVPSAIRFPTTDHVQFNIVSACTGISAITLFVGLVAVADERVSKRLTVGAGVVGFVYVMNVVRTVLVSGAIGGEWFAFTAPVVTPVYGIEDPALVSFYFAEHLLSQILIVAVLLTVYVDASNRLPSLQTFLTTALDSGTEDCQAARATIGATLRTGGSD